MSANTESSNLDQMDFGSRQWMLLVLPLIILAILIWMFVQLNPLQALIGAAPPVEELTIDRFTLSDDGIKAYVINGGPDPVTIAQVFVDEAYWNFSISPAAELPRLGRAIIDIPYPWVEGEAHEVVLVTNTGVTFDGAIDVALETPIPGTDYWLMFAILGFYVGIVPVGLGLLWFPLLRRLGKKGINFILTLTVGLLVFLLADTALEAIEISEGLPEVFQAVPLIFFAGLLSFMALVAIGRKKETSTSDVPRNKRLWLATSIAIGIGLHNLGEGMAIGAAVALGEAALGTFLVIGFTLHNLTEGIGIGAPVAKDRPGIGRLLGLAVIAGGPAILGTWIGGFAFSPFWAVIFLAIGTGAILQVVYEVTRLLFDSNENHQLFTWPNIAGLTLGLGIMYLTALLVKF